MLDPFNKKISRSLDEVQKLDQKPTWQLAKVKPSFRLHKWVHQIDCHLVEGSRWLRNSHGRHKPCGIVRVQVRFGMLARL